MTARTAIVRLNRGKFLAVCSGKGDRVGMAERVHKIAPTSYLLPSGLLTDCQAGVRAARSIAESTRDLTVSEDNGDDDEMMGERSRCLAREVWDGLYGLDVCRSGGWRGKSAVFILLDGVDAMKTYNDCKVFRPHSEEGSVRAYLIDPTGYFEIGRGYTIGGGAKRVNGAISQREEGGEERNAKEITKQLAEEKT